MNHNAGQKIFTLLEEAAKYSEPGPGVTRVLGSAEHKALLPELEKWMQDAGLQTHLDAAGNLIGRFSSSVPSDKTFIIGSHQDTVIQGGKYDGMLGIIAPLMALKELHEEKVSIPCNVELIAFSDEEGVRFPTTLIGSSPLAGRFDMKNLNLKDKDGITLKQALLEIGGRPDEIPELVRDPEKTVGYLEMHIEQGPVLESEGLPVGIVSAITGIERHSVTIEGQAGHAGTIPMELRKDALVGAAEIVGMVDRICKENDKMVGVVGSLNVTPNAVNVVPGKVELTIELRSPESQIRVSARKDLISLMEKRMSEMGIGISHHMTYSQDEVKCSQKIQDGLEKAIKAQNLKPRYLFSGAGHDGLAMSYLTDIGMLFVRCKNGTSHHPDESITMEDAQTASNVVKEFIKNIKA